MDNDRSLKKALVKAYRNTRLKIDYAGMNLLSESGGNDLIKEYVSEGKPFMLGRFGAVEMRCVSRWMNRQACTDQECDQAMHAAGIFPNDQKTIDKFCGMYTEAIRSCDLLGVWEVTGEKAAVKKYCPKAQLVPSRSIEPYYFEKPWTAALKGKKVLVVHPFVESIKKQIVRINEIWPDKRILPDFKEVSYVKAIQSNAGAKTEFEDWFFALDHMKKQIDRIDFDLAIIGAGAYGLSLAAYVKGLGKQVIQMSGATQILFGIKGKRWDEHPMISKLYNDAWIRPNASETPPDTKKVEGGSYW